MKILQVITLCELGGAQSVVINLANELCKEHEVIVASGEGDGKMWTMLDSKVKRIHCKHLKRELSPINDLRTLFDFYSLCRKYKPDIIHLHSSKAGMLGRMAFPSKKVIYTVHGFDSIRLVYRKFLPIERFMQRYCKAIVGVSKYDEKWLKYEGIIRNVCVIYNGVNKLEKKIPQLPFMELKRKNILCIARLSPQKRTDLFLEVASLLPEYNFIWIGNQHAVDEHTQNVYFLGNIPNASVYNQIADLFILPSNYEGLPMVIIEAMSYGCPIVASNVGGISEIVRNGQNGYVVNNDAKEFSEKIRDILEDEEKHSKFSENSYHLFQEQLTVQKMVESYVELYNK